MGVQKHTGGFHIETPRRPYPADYIRGLRPRGATGSSPFAPFERNASLRGPKTSSARCTLSTAIVPVAVLKRTLRPIFGYSARIFAPTQLSPLTASSSIPI